MLACRFNTLYEDDDDDDQRSEVGSAISKPPADSEAMPSREEVDAAVRLVCLSIKRASNLLFIPCSAA